MAIIIAINTLINIYHWFISAFIAILFITMPYFHYIAIYFRLSLATLILLLYYYYCIDYIILLLRMLGFLLSLLRLIVIFIFSLHLYKIPPHLPQIHSQHTSTLHSFSSPPRYQSEHLPHWGITSSACITSPNERGAIFIRAFE